MAGPRHKDCNCRCEPPPTDPDCAGCTGGQEASIGDTIDVTMTSLSWSHPDTDVCTDSYSYPLGFPPTVRGVSSEINVRRIDIAGIGNRTLRKRPTLSSQSKIRSVESTGFLCSWLWDDVEAIECVFHHDPGAVVDVVSTYTPVNATDSTNPWDRVFTSISDSRCGTAFSGGDGSNTPYGKWHCYTGWCGIALSVDVYPGPTSGSEWTYGGAAKWWVCHVWLTVFYYGTQSPTGASVFFPIAAGPGVPWTYPINNPACMDMFPNLGGAVLTYAKPVDCSADFTGSAIVLPLNLLHKSRADDWGITYPSSVSVTL